MTKFFRRIPWTDILIVILVGTMLIGGIAGITASVKNDQTTVSSTEFKRGALDANGLYVESKTSIYTKDLIECQGLEIEPDFEVSGTYQVFYYDVNKSFLVASELMDAQTDGVYMKGNEYPLAKYCRIVISPAAPVDEDGYVDEDWKIKFYEVTSIANKYTIKVDKKQKMDLSGYDMLTNIKVYENRSNQTYSNYRPDHYSHEGYSCSDTILTYDYKRLELIAPSGCRIQVVFYDENGINVAVDDVFDANALASDVSVSEIIDIPSGAVFMAFNFIPSDTSVAGYHVYLKK